ncbi:MAG: hypothetical protein QOH31_3383 [Verrucomicrobiota bacterium]|jgi:hypothetical protein
MESTLSFGAVAKKYDEAFSQLPCPLRHRHDADLVISAAETAGNA